MSAHTDKRRTLTEFGVGKTWKVCKIIATKEDCVLGRHYHKRKDESFMLVAGQGRIKIGDQLFTMKLFEEYFVLRYIKHEFTLTKGSILIGLCSEEFDPNDDYA